MARIALLALAILLSAGSSSAVSLSFTPDQSVYQVGEQITLSVLGDPMGMAASRIQGRMLYDAGLAEHVSSTQVQLTSFGGFLPWTLGSLDSGPGFSDAFLQLVGNGEVPDDPLSATVVLSAVAPGTLSIDWQTTGNNNITLNFFGITSSPGVTVTIIPEPATIVLVALGLTFVGLKQRRGSLPSATLPPDRT